MSAATTAEVLEMTGIAVPFLPPPGQLVADRSASGDLNLYYERLDARSVQRLPPRLPLVGPGHSNDRPIGWARLTPTADGLRLRARLAPTQSARDAAVLAEEQLLGGFSISFTTSGEDQWTRGEEGGLPSVLRRGVELTHVAAVWKPAYSAALIEGVYRNGQTAPAVPADLEKQREEGRRSREVLQRSMRLVEESRARSRADAERTEWDAATPVWVVPRQRRQSVYQMDGPLVAVDARDATSLHEAREVIAQANMVSPVHYDLDDPRYLSELRRHGVYYLDVPNGSRLLGDEQRGYRLVLSASYPKGSFSR